MTSIGISNILPLLIAFQSLLFAFILLTDNGPKKTSNRLLAGFLAIIFVQFLLIIFQYQPSLEPIANLYMCVFGFAYGPLLYIYAISLIYNDFYLKPFQFLHGVPVVVILISPSIGYSLCEFVGPFMYLSLAGYIGVAIREIIKYRKVIKNTQSVALQADLQWLQWILIIFSVALLLDVIDHFFFYMDILPGVSLTHLGIFLLINRMFYKGLKQPQIFLGISNSEESISQSIREKIKEEESLVKPELEQITSHLSETKPFTNPMLSLKELADQLGMPERRLSYLINSYLDQNFMGLINKYRIETAVMLLKNPKDKGETIQEVMYKVGFNSKSSFNTLFKEATGFTPSEFKKQAPQK